MAAGWSNTPSGSRPSSRTPSASVRASRRWRRKRWNARSARQSGCSTSGRRGKHQTTADREEIMTNSPSRRDILISSTALAAAAVFPSLGFVSTAMADSSSPTAAEIVAAIRNKKMTAVGAVQAALERAEQLKDLNAFIILNKDGALAAAAKVDSGEKTGALAGLPIVVKDNINTADMPTTAGTPALQNARPTGNAPSLQKLLDAGAIMIGNTNMHELAFGITSTNLSPFAGPVKNPYDKTRIPGGSSGGTAAAVAARIVSCGLGSDTGGSTRVPAALTGTVGLRPSVGNGGPERRYDDANLVVPIRDRKSTRLNSSHMSISYAVFCLKKKKKNNKQKKYKKKKKTKKKKT